MQSFLLFSSTGNNQEARALKEINLPIKQDRVPTNCNYRIKHLLNVCLFGSVWTTCEAAGYIRTVSATLLCTARHMVKRLSMFSTTATRQGRLQNKPATWKSKTCAVLAWLSQCPFNSLLPICPARTPYVKGQGIYRQFTTKKYHWPPQGRLWLCDHHWIFLTGVLFSTLPRQSVSQHYVPSRQGTLPRQALVRS